MLQLLLEWLFALCCLLPVGLFVLRLFPASESGRHTALHAVLLGLVTVTVLATLWSFAGPIAGAFDAVLFAMALVLAAAQRQELFALLNGWARRWRSAHVLVRIASVLLLLIVLLKSASPSEVLDEGGYYLPYIRWIERFPLVPGIGNIEDRLGFNSAFHMASAVFGLAWLIPGGAYDLNGLLLLCVGGWFLGGVDDLLRKRPATASAVMKVFGLFFLMRNVLTGPAADLSNMLFAEVVLVLLMERIEEGRARIADRELYLLVAYGLFVATIKFSSLLVLIGPAYLVVRMVLQRVRIRWGMLVAMTALIVAPWLVRSYYLSGYLVYPLHQVDLFSPDWKVPKATAVRQYHYVSEFAKTNAKPGQSAALAERSVAQWAPAWFKRENAFNKAMAVAVVLGSIALVLLAFLRRKRTIDADRVAYVLFLWLLLAVWFLKNPAFRFGWAWIIVFVAVAFHAVVGRLAEGRVLRAASLGLFALFLLQSAVKSVAEDRKDIAHQLLYPTPTRSGTCASHACNGMPVCVSTTEFCWGAEPPCFPSGALDHVEPRGPSVTDGFRPRAK